MITLPTAENPIKVVIDRKTWCRTMPEKTQLNEISSEDTCHYLLTKSGNRCCMGFACKAMGMADKYLLERLWPSDIGVDIFDKEKDIGFINDHPINSCAIRDSQTQEARITEEFAKVHLIAEFIN